MTTIAYKEGVIAYDSRVTQGSLIDDDEYEKMVELEDYKFIFAGSICDTMKFVDAYFTEDMSYDGDVAQAFVVNPDGRLEIVEVDESLLKLSSYFPRMNYHYAIGSGNEFALAYMDMGRSAEAAVKLVAKRDCKTGGLIRTIKLA